MVTAAERSWYDTSIHVVQPTCQVLDDCCHVDGRPHADAILVCPGAQVPHHPSHREDDARPG